MKKYKLINKALICILLLVPTFALAHSDNFCKQAKGARLIANDGTYLGRLTVKYKRNSIFNRHGAYGSKNSPTSIWNKHGIYGNNYSPNSPFNKHSTKAPMLIKKKRIIAYISINKHVWKAISPLILRTCE